MNQNLKPIVAHFDHQGEFVSAAPYGGGHIHDTYAGVYNHNGSPLRYIHQRINHEVFKDPVSLMENIERVTAHLAHDPCYADNPDRDRRFLTLVPTRDGKSYYRDPDGHFWRTFVFIEKATTFDAVETPRQAYEAAKAFGQFQHQLDNLPAPRLHETIPDFHHTRARFTAFQDALRADRHNRAATAAPEIAQAHHWEPIVDVLLDLQQQGTLPERITHNDTKLNNVMIDDDTSEGICVIDLDTVMPGLALYDFGDLVRTATCPVAEDEQDLSEVTMEMTMFKALTDGYLASAGVFLTPAERDQLPFAGQLITFEIGLRFLTDYLAGDVYFKIHRDGHNLDRCRTQFALAASIESQQDAMALCVQELADRAGLARP